MDNNRKKIIVYVICASIIALNFFSLLGLIFGAQTLVRDQSMVDHTYRVISEIEIVSNLYKTADYTGRNRNLTGNDTIQLGDSRREAIKNAVNLKTIVSDNAEQLKNLDLLISDFHNRFNSQDEQFAALTRENGTITYPLEAISKGSQYAERIESLFSTLKFNELNLLNGERLPKLKDTQWRVIYWLFGLIGFDFICALVLGFKYIGVIAFMSGVKNAVKKVKKNPSDENWNELENYIEGKRAYLNSQNVFTGK